MTGSAAAGSVWGGRAVAASGRVGGGETAKAAATSRGHLSVARTEPETAEVAGRDFSTAPSVETGPTIASLEDLAALAETNRDSLMRVSIRRYLRLVRIVPGRLEVGLTPEAPKNLVGDLMRRIHQWTGVRWVVTVSSGEGQKTLDEAVADRRARLLAEAEADPEVVAVLAAFPGAKVVDVRLRGDAEADAEKAELATELPRDGVLEDDLYDDPAGYTVDPDIEIEAEIAGEGDPGRDPEDPGFDPQGLQEERP